MNKKIFPFLGSYPVSQAFGNLDVPDPTVYQKHEGTDYATPIGTQVLASDDGVVTIAGMDPYGFKYKGGYGYMIQIVFTDGTIGLLGHLSRIDVKVNQQVKQGQVIGLSGNSGFSTGAHLHAGLKYKGVWIDPDNVLVQWTDTVTPIPDTVIPDVVSPVADTVLGECVLPSDAYTVVSEIGLNVRALPSTDSAILFRMDDGQKLNAIAEHTDDNGNHWLGFVVWCAQIYNGVELVKKI